MPIGVSNGLQFEDQTTLALGMPLQGPEEATGASKSDSGSKVPADDNTSVRPSQQVIIDTTNLDNTDDAQRPVQMPDGPDPAKGQQGVLDKLFGLNGPRYQTWPERLVRSALTAAGDAYSGELPMWAQNEDGSVNTSPMAIERANDLATFAVLGPAPVAAKLADGTLGSFAGVKSKTLNAKRLEAAQEFEDSGMRPDDIWTQTGFARGADGQWRYEIPDNTATISPNFIRDNKVYTPKDQLVPLGAVLNHPELYKAYPNLKEIYVAQHTDPNSIGMMDSKNGILYLSSGQSASEAKRIILHELQHDIQETEGFARGGTFSTSEDMKLNYYKTIDKMRQESNDILDKYKQDGILTKTDHDKLLKTQDVLKLELARREAGLQRALENYYKLAGEVESRNVEYRDFLTPKGRQLQPPYRTEDVLRANQVVSNEVQHATPYGYTTRSLEPPMPE